ncbi:hypothetical protein [Streptomyces albogriseolus]|uniref:hypothetical protein n=1 Tax=Streptomyces albogriseolus TaxID=1887 RepID=UPI00224E509B|nr:hypothetical protein [Streptomyces viridodiastaticus]MCX4623127.1 hypothetical protein [Streptomyces viridodiastaticus]
MFRASLRSWLVLAVPVVGVLVLTYSATSPEPRADGDWQVAAEPLRDGPLPSGGTAQLSTCGVDTWPRPEPRGKAEQSEDPRLALTSWGYYDPGPKTPGEPRFTVHAAIRTGDRPLVLDAPVAAGRVTLDFYGPHGEGVRASARGLTATVVDGGYPGKPVDVPASGRFQVDPGEELLLEVELPAGAVCPGHSLRDVSTCLPEGTNDAADCPMLTLTLSDPAIRAYRAGTADDSTARSFSDRLVAVFLEPDVSRV